MPLIGWLPVIFISIFLITIAIYLDLEHRTFLKNIADTDEILRERRRL